MTRVWNQCGLNSRIQVLASRVGRALVVTGKYDEARIMLNRAMEIDTAFTLPHFLLGYVATLQKPPDTADAIRHLEYFIDTPEGHALGDDATQKHLIQQAQGLIRSLK